MKDNIKELQTLIHKVPIKRAKTTNGMDTEKVYLENGSEGLKEYTQNLESLEEVELVDETPCRYWQAITKTKKRWKKKEKKNCF